MSLQTVVFSRHFSKWWCCSSKISSSLKSSESNPFCSCRNILLSANFFLFANAADELAFATRMRAKRAFLWAFRLSALWFWWYILLKLDTMTGTGRAMTSTPLNEQTPPTILPAMVSGTFGEWEKMDDDGDAEKKWIRSRGTYHVTIA